MYRSIYGRIEQRGFDQGDHGPLLIHADFDVERLLAKAFGVGFWVFPPVTDDTPGATAALFNASIFVIALRLVFYLRFEDLGFAGFIEPEHNSALSTGCVPRAINRIIDR